MRRGKQTLGINELSNAKEDADVDVYDNYTVQWVVTSGMNTVQAIDSLFAEGKFSSMVTC
jgi:hypothetical protein